MELDDFREEIKLMKTIGYHRNIVNLVGCSTINKPLCLIVEYMPNGDLLHFLRQRRSKVIILEFVDPYHATGLFLYSLKASENFWLSNVFRGYRRRPVVWKELSIIFVLYVKYS